MIVAIDPDVFTAAESDLNSTLSLIGLSQKCSEMRFAVDGDEIEREYLRLFFRYYKEVTNTEDDNESLKAILKLLRIILDDTDEYREVIANHRERWLDQLIAKHGCTTKVEPELLGICQNAKGMGLVLLLVGNKASRLGLRNRGLRNAKVRWKFRSSMHWLDVRFTDDTDIVPAPVKEVPEKDLQDRLFELQSGFHLQTQEPQLRCIPTPPGMGEQIDIYARKEYREAGHPVLETLVGECKLRKEGNEENKPIASGEVTQTFRKVYAAARYEHRRLSRSLARPIVRMRGALITNVFEFEGEKEDFVLCAINHLNANWPMSVHNLCSSIEIDFMEASLPRGWTNRADWEINHLGHSGI
jgi:hypothetical protein